MERIESALTEGAAHMAAALCRWLGDLAAFDRRQGWASWGCRSAAHWLTFRCGVDLPAAREQVKVAARLTELPRIRQAFAQGALSWWQVRQLTRVATPQTDQQLLDLARAAATTQLTAIVSGLKRALALDAGLHPRRTLRWWVDEDGFVVFSGRLGPDDGALVAKALDALVDDLLRAKRQRTLQVAAHVPDTPEDPPGDADDPVGATRADALVRMARLALAASKPGTTSKPATGDDPAPDIADRAQVVVHVDHAVLSNATGAHDERQQAPAPRSTAAHGTDGTEAPGSLSPSGECSNPGYSEARCELEGGAAIPPETALRLACDASVVRVIEDRDGTPLDIGRKTRTIGPALRRALRARDRGCRFPGCHETRFVEGHHLTHWAHGGPTSLANLTELCRFHHRLLHEGGYRIEGTAPYLRFLRPDGTPIERPPPPGPSDGDLERANRTQGLAIDATTIVSEWRGERLDLGYVVSCVMGPRAAGRSAPPPAEPPRPESLRAEPPSDAPARAAPAPASPPGAG